MVSSGGQIRRGARISASVSRRADEPTSRRADEPTSRRADLAPRQGSVNRLRRSRARGRRPVRASGSAAFQRRAPRSGGCARG
ncbi:hypothetical protein B0A89_09950 [Paracoccus contaminans]|uniref:Uncharacterized protein n=1 Tax=Paracoccus contaminans TaxID=1945662 RepID=A0A1W6CYH1_9RHOB|nr:hypothetical protein B0A89_09950 [Paracoccus contaminans]